MLLALLLTLLLLQATTPLGMVLAAAFAALNGWLSTKLYDGIKTVFPWWDSRPAIYHQIAAPLFQFGFGWLSAATGLELLTDISGINAGWIAGGLNLLVAAGIKRWEKSRAPTDTTEVLLASRKAVA